MHLVELPANAVDERATGGMIPTIPDDLRRLSHGRDPAVRGGTHTSHMGQRSCHSDIGRRRVRTGRRDQLGYRRSYLPVSVAVASVCGATASSTSERLPPYSFSAGVFSA